MIKIENDPNHITDGHPIVWTNFIMFGLAETVMSAKYLQPNVGLDPDHYVRDFKVGLVEMKTTLKFYRGTVPYFCIIPSHIRVRRVNNIFCN